jgi:hypothetical protein
MSVVAIILLEMVTLGLYSGFWYLRRLQAINRNSTAVDDEIPAALPVVQIILRAATALCALVSLYFMVSMGVPEAAKMLKSTRAIINIADWICLLALAFMTRTILQPKFEPKLSAVYTFLFTTLYLQYRINRLPSGK